MAIAAKEQEQTQSRFVYRRPKWGRGMITEDDARFLHDLILEVRPSVAIELGVASGCSSAVILEAMRQGAAPARGTWLHAFDISERCYFDPSHATGDAVAELTPWNAPHYVFTAGDVLLARERLAGLNAPFAFIDANHLHPWATADLLGLLPALAPGSWVALHDIRLPFVPGRTDPRGHGARHLFEAWPGEKRHGAFHPARPRTDGVHHDHADPSGPERMADGCRAVRPMTRAPVLAAGQADQRSPMDADGSRR